MDGLEKYLKKHKNLSPPSVSAKKIFISVVKKEYGVTIKESEVTIRGSGVYLSCHPIARSEVVFNAARILEDLLEKYNIRFSFIR